MLIIVCLQGANILIYYDIYIGDPFIFDIGGMLRDSFAKAWGIGLDEKFGTTFFAPVFVWTAGSIDYLGLYGSAFIIPRYWFGLDNLDMKYAYPIYLGFVAFITIFYFYGALDNYSFFYWLSIPSKTSTMIKSYYWVGLAFGTLMTLFEDGTFRPWGFIESWWEHRKYGKFNY